MASSKKLQGNLQKYCQKGAKIDVPILAKVQKTHDTYIYTLGLPDATLPLGLSPGMHIYLYAKVPTKKKPQGESIKRIYSPISSEDQLGTFDLQFKVYRKGTNAKYPEGGPMSQYLETKNVGDKLTISGPLAGFYYETPGCITIAGLVHIPVKNFGMICGGTGINVMYPIIKAILNDPADKTNVTLLFANKTEADILMKDELEALPSDPRFKIYYTISSASPGWTGFEGHITKEMIAKTMPAPGKDTFVWVCGPVDMDNAAEKILVQQKHKKSRLMISSNLNYFARHILRSFCCCCCGS